MQPVGSTMAENNQKYKMMRIRTLNLLLFLVSDSAEPGFVSECGLCRCSLVRAVKSYAKVIAQIDQTHRSAL
jgi:hypothetical protein